nr:uncharacterized protein LOC113734802 [Coffea arabica]
MYTADASFQLIYFAKGSGVIRISGMTGGKALDARVQSGQLLVVPKFFSAAKVADGDGLEYFSVVTSLEPSFVQLAGKCHWKAMAPSVLQVSFNVIRGSWNFSKTRLPRVKLLFLLRIELRNRT